MTTRTTAMRQGRQDVRGLIAMTAATLALVGGVLLWQARPRSEASAPATTTSGVFDEGVAPRGGMAERYGELQRDGAARAAARVTTTGGMAELHAEREAEARSAVERDARMGGMAELYREQEAARRTPAS